MKIIDPKNKVNFALVDYYFNNDGNSGFNILRYFKMGYIEPTTMSVMLHWYPNKIEYAILRMAKMGLLKFRQKQNGEPFYSLLEYSTILYPVE